MLEEDLEEGRLGGIAGFVSGRVDASLGPVDGGGSVALRINNTGEEIDETIDYEGFDLAIRFGADEGDIFEVSVSDLTLNIADFVSIAGNVSFSSGVADWNGTGQTARTFAGEDLELFMGDGPLRLDDGQLNPLARGATLSGASVGLIELTDGDGVISYALSAVGTVSLVGLEGVTITGDAVIRVNTTEMAINESLTIAGSRNEAVEVLFDDGDEVLEFAALGATLSVSGQTLSGDFSFSQESATDSESLEKILLLAASGVNLSLGSSDAGIGISDGSGILRVTGGGLAGSLTGTVALDIPGVRLDNDFTITMNTGPDAVSETLGAVALELPAGPFFRAESSGTMTVLGQGLPGSFVIETVVEEATEQLTVIVADGVEVIFEAEVAPVKTRLGCYCAMGMELSW